MWLPSYGCLWAEELVREFTIANCPLMLHGDEGILNESCALNVQDADASAVCESQVVRRQAHLRATSFRRFDIQCYVRSIRMHKCAVC